SQLQMSANVGMSRKVKTSSFLQSENFLFWQCRSGADVRVPIMDRGFFLTLQAMRRQLEAMPCDYYQLRLIHSLSRKPFPADQVWSAQQLTRAPMVAFLRLRNREGYDVFFHPFAGDRNAGYILLDLDCPDDQTIDTMRANGHAPCVVVRTSPG